MTKIETFPGNVTLHPVNAPNVTTTATVRRAENFSKETFTYD